MEGFREFVNEELKIRSIEYRPNFVPSSKIHKGGGGKMNPFKAINPSRPYQPTFRMGKSVLKSQIAMKKH